MTNFSQEKDAWIDKSGRYLVRREWHKGHVVSIGHPDQDLATGKPPGLCDGTIATWKTRLRGATQTGRAEPAFCSGLPDEPRTEPATLHRAPRRTRAARARWRPLPRQAPDLSCVADIVEPHSR